MSTEAIERELSDLKKRLETLEAKTNPAAKGAWRELIGWETDDILFREAIHLGAEWRKQANAEGH